MSRAKQPVLVQGEKGDRSTAEFQDTRSSEQGNIVEINLIKILVQYFFKCGTLEPGFPCLLCDQRRQHTELAFQPVNNNPVINNSD